MIPRSVPASFAVKPVKEINEPEDEEEFMDEDYLPQYEDYSYIDDEDNWYTLEGDDTD